MTDYEGRYDGNGEDADNYGDGGSSPQPRATNHGGPDDYSDSKSQVHQELQNHAITDFLFSSDYIKLRSLRRGSVYEGVLGFMLG